MKNSKNNNINLVFSFMHLVSVYPTNRTNFTKKSEAIVKGQCEWLIQDICSNSNFKSHLSSKYKTFLHFDQYYGILAAQYGSWEILWRVQSSYVV